MTLHVKDGGVWKDATSDGLQVKDGGVWKESGEGHIKDGGVWKQFHQSQYLIERSLRFNSSDSAYLSRTPSTAGNRKTWTWAGWVKRTASTAAGGVATYQAFFEADVPGTRTSVLYNGDQIDFFTDNISSSRLTTAPVFRDFSAWQHVVLRVDTTQATAANRVRIYINGTQVTQFSTASYPAQNLDTAVNTTKEHRIGKTYDNYYFDGYLAEVHLIDGQALDPTSFGGFDADGVWQPIAYTGSYGTNGFYLDFSDNSSTSALGTDSSGNGNNWTANNFSVTAGAGNDSLLDSPTNGTQTDTGAGGEISGNYCTLNPNSVLNSWAIAKDGNLVFNIFNQNSYWRSMTGTLGVSSGKYYFEARCLRSPASIGVARIDVDPMKTETDVGGDASLNWVGYNHAGIIKQNGTGTSGNATFSANDYISVALDMDAGTVKFYKNGSLQPTTKSGLSGTYIPIFASIFDGDTWQVNFGQRPFIYSAPSNHKTFCTANLDDPTIADGTTVVDAKLYTGNGSTQTISGLGFSPDLVWLKSRTSGGSAFTNHVLVDSVRGSGSFGLKNLYANTSEAEFNPGSTAQASVTSLNTDGFALGGNSNTNFNTGTYVAWAWDAGSSTVTNNDGSITSSVRANPSAGFSIVTYTGTGANATVGHGLNSKPGLVVIKRREGSYNWVVWSNAITGSQYLIFNNTNPVGTAGDVWNATIPTSTVFSLGTDLGVNASGGTFVAYCFAPVAGYSSFGSYVGNGNSRGPFIYTGFRPRWVIIKASSTTGEWGISDAVRDPYNVVSNVLLAESNFGDNTGLTLMDFTSNGFKLRNTNANRNGIGITYIWAAFAESPFKYARAR